MSQEYKSYNTLAAIFKEVYNEEVLKAIPVTQEKTAEEWKKEYHNLLSKHQDYRLAVQLFQDAAKDVLLGGLDTESIAKLQEALAKAWNL